MIAKEEIEQIISRLEKLEEEKADVAQNITDTLAEAKIKGYDVKILKQLLKLRKIDEEERIQQEEELETYKAALGMK
jgi:uncharacterized protein (UPF0335 family)